MNIAANAFATFDAPTTDTTELEYARKMRETNSVEKIFGILEFLQAEVQREVKLVGPGVRYDPDVAFRHYVNQTLGGMGVKAEDIKNFLYLYEAAQEAEEDLEFEDVHDLMAGGFTKMNWVLADKIPHGAMVLLHAMGGVGKTLLAMDIGKHVAAGKPWNGLNVTQGPVLVCQGEQPRTIEQMRAYKSRIHKEVPKGSFLYMPKDWRLSQVGRLVRKIKRMKTPPVLIILDSLFALNDSPYDENSREWAKPLIKIRQEICDVFGCAVIFIHHETESSGSSRGTKAVPAAVDEVWRLWYDAKALNNRYLRFWSTTKTRSSQMGTVTIQLNSANYSWRVHWAANDADTESRLLMFFRQNPGKKYSPYGLGQEAGIPARDVATACRSLYIRGLIDIEYHEEKIDGITTKVEYFFCPDDGQLQRLNEVRALMLAALEHEDDYLEELKTNTTALERSKVYFELLTNADRKALAKIMKKLGGTDRPVLEDIEYPEVPDTFTPNIDNSSQAGDNSEHHDEDNGDYSNDDF